MSEGILSEEDVKHLISGLRDLATSRYVTIAGYAVLIYDHILTFPIEIELIWGKPKNLVSYSFMFNRYGVPLFVALDILQILGAARNVPDRFCHDWLYAEGFLQIVCHGIAHWLAALRVRALHSGRPWVDPVLYISGALYMVGTVIVLFLVLVYVAKTYVWNTTLNMCFGVFPSWMYWCWVPGLIFELILFGLIAVKAVHDWRRDLAFPITRLLYRDGFIYFIVITACSVFNIITWAALPSTMVALAKYFGFSLVAVMSSRIVLNLRTLRQRRPPESEGVETGSAFELGVLRSIRKPRRSAYQGAHHGQSHRISMDLGSRRGWPQPAPSSVWPLSQSEVGCGDPGRRHPSSVPVTARVGGQLEVGIDELDEDGSDNQGERV